MALYNNVSPPDPAAPPPHHPHPTPTWSAMSITLQGTQSHDITLTFSLIGEVIGCTSHTAEGIQSTHMQRGPSSHTCREDPVHTHAEGIQSTHMQRGSSPHTCGGRSNPHTCRGENTRQGLAHDTRAPCPEPSLEKGVGVLLCGYVLQV